MALPETDAEWVNHLSRCHDSERPELEELNSYYEGTQPLTYMHPEVFREVADRIQPVIIGWPQLVVDTIEERLDVTGFRLPDKDESEKDLWRVWQANDMDEQVPMAHIDALVMRRSYIAVGTNEEDDDTPLVTAESPLEVYADIDPRTRKVRAALRRVVDNYSFARVAERTATLYLPNATIWYDWAKGGWREQRRDDHGIGEVSIVPLVNRPRLSYKPKGNLAARKRLGVSEFAPILPLSDAANKLATDMMVAAEAVALPLRGFLGIGEDDLRDIDGNPLTAVQAVLRKLLTLGGDAEGVKPFDFPAANLSNFHNSIDALAKIVMSVAALTPGDMGFTTDNPASADAIRSNEIRKIKRCERKQRSFGGSYEKVGRLIRRYQSGDWDPELRLLEALWVSAATPTVAQQADAALKLYNTPPGKPPIVPLKQTRRDLGYTETQIANMERDDEVEARLAAERDPIAPIAQGLAMGRVNQVAAVNGDGARAGA